MVRNILLKNLGYFRATANVSVSRVVLVIIHLILLSNFLNYKFMVICNISYSTFIFKNTWKHLIHTSKINILTCNLDEYTMHASGPVHHPPHPCSSPGQWWMDAAETSGRTGTCTAGQAPGGPSGPGSGDQPLWILLLSSCCKDTYGFW